jgi:DNA replication protein DnaC
MFTVPATPAPATLERWQSSAQRHTAQAAEVAASINARYQAMRDRTPRNAVPIAADMPNAANAGDCPRCQNHRWLIDDVGRLTPCPDCGVAIEWRAQSLKTYSSHVGRAEQQTFDNFNVAVKGRDNPSLQLCLDAAKQFAEQPEGFLLIHGQPGNGKSHLCAAVANHVRAAGVPVIFITMPELCSSLKATFDDDAEQTTTERTNVYKTAPVLILDDIGAEKRSEWSEVVLFELIDYRYRNRLPTMFVTNLDPRDRHAFDWRVVDRWTDHEIALVVHNAAPSHRQMEAQR